MKKDRVYFLAKDPHWTFIWWDIAPETIDKLKTEQGLDLSTARLTLRVHDVTDIIFDGGNSHFFFDIDVIGNTDHWYLDIWTCNRNYCVEVGLKQAGWFHPIVRSNTVALPSDHPSGAWEERWSTLEI